MKTWMIVSAAVAWLLTAAPALAAGLPQQLRVNDGGTGASDAPTARSNLGLTYGKSVGNPGTSTLEALWPIQTVTGSAHTYVCGTDIFVKTRRSNSGTVMTDTLPASSAPCVNNGAQLQIANVDAAVSITLTAGSGTTINGNATLTIGPGRDVWLAYDSAASAWRPQANSTSTLLSGNNLQDVASPSTARANIGAAESGANGDINELRGLTTPLSVAQGGLSGLTFSLSAAGIGTPTGPMSGYAAGDVVTLQCPGVTFASGQSPTVAITTASAGNAGSVSLTKTGVTSFIPSASMTCTQSSATGGGTGIQVPVSFGVVASYLSPPSLGTGGAANNGNFLLNLGPNDQLATGAWNFAGNETVAVGDLACTGLTGASNENACFGHNAGGQQTGTTVVSNSNAFFGADAARNLAGGASSGANTAVGNGACRNLAGGFNTCLGFEALGNNGVNQGGQMSGFALTAVGNQAGLNITSGAGSTLIGNKAGSVLTTGTNDIIIQATGGSDGCSNGPFESNVVALCAGAGRVFTITGSGTPATSVTTIAGSINANGAFLDHFGVNENIGLFDQSGTAKLSFVNDAGNSLEPGIISALSLSVNTSLAEVHLNTNENIGLFDQSGTGKISFVNDAGNALEPGIVTASSFSFVVSSLQTHLGTNENIGLFDQGGTGKISFVNDAGSALNAGIITASSLNLVLNTLQLNGASLPSKTCGVLPTVSDGFVISC